MANVRVELIADGGNPRSEHAIVEKDGVPIVYPFSEDGDPNYKFRLDVALVNESDRPTRQPIVVEWGDAEYAKFRRYLLLTAGEEDWRRIDAAVEGTRATATLDVPPGRSRLGMHPPYDYGRLTRVLAGLPAGRVRVESIGKSLHGRDIYAASAGDESARPLVVIVRVHPYESIGSYFADGMLRWLASADSDGALAGRGVAILPMPNPDGVAEGLCKKTLGGLDVNEAAGSPEPEGVALRRFITDVRPQATFDLHGYMWNNHGYGTTDLKRGEAIRDALLASPKLFNKIIRVSESKTTEGGSANLGQYATEAFGSVRFSGSWSWFGHSAADLRAMGVEIVRAYLAQF